MFKIHENKLFLILIFLHLCIVLPLAFYLNVWTDEASTLHTTQNGFFYAVHNAAADEKQAPLYFWALSLWREINHSIIFARLFSIVCSILSIKYFTDLTRKFFDEKAAVFISVFFALHPILIWASLEIRVYATVILISVLLLKFFYDGYLAEENDSSESLKKQKRTQIFYCATAVIALYTNYYLGFLLIGNFCALLVIKRFQKAKTYFWQMIFVGILTLPLMFIIGQQFAANTSGFRDKTSLYKGLKIIWGNSLNLIFPTELSPSSEQTIVSAARIWLVRLGILTMIFILIKNKFRDIDWRILIFGTITIVVCAIMLGIYFLTGVEYIALRHTTPCFISLILLSASLIVKLIPRKSWLILALVFACLFSYSFYNQYSPLAKRGDWIRVAKFIEANEKNNQPIIVFQNYDALSLPYYYRGENKILPDKNFFAWSNEADLKSENALQKQTDFIISQIPPDAKEIWLATEEICQNEDTSASCQPLENYVEMNYNVLRTQDFYKERVRLLQKK